MVSRLILNLRSQAHSVRPSVSFPSANAIMVSPPTQSELTSTVTGNLGEPIVTDWLDSEEDVKESQVYTQTMFGESLDVTELNVIEPTQSFSSRVLTAPATTQVVVEVTRSVRVEDAQNDSSSAFPTLAPKHSDSQPPRGSERFLGVHEDEYQSHGPLFPRSPPHSHRITQTQDDSRTMLGRRSRRDDQWFPPDSWRVEGVDNDELGKLRRQRPGRRPRTS